MATHYLFDVDGTLTPSRQNIDTIFASEFLAICCDHNVSLVTGSDYKKTCEQLNPAIINATHYIFNCSGNQVRYRNKIVYESTWTAPSNLLAWLNAQLTTSKFVLRTGNHTETRTGSINFSVVGRNATLAERKLYINWDQQTKERLHLVNQINKQFTDIEASIGGETGIDISARGLNKSQVISWFDTKDKLIFFGDCTAPGGNDYPLAQALKHRLGVVYTVHSWTQTRELLQILFNYTV
jgi:phosphomannomutase